MAQHLVVAGFFNVESFSLEGKDGLEAAISTLLGGAAGALTFDKIQFATLGVALGTIGQLAGQTAAVQGALSARQVASFAGGFACTCRFNRLVYNFARDRRVLLEEHAEALIDKSLHDARDVGVELAFGLAFELRLRQL